MCTEGLDVLVSVAYLGSRKGDVYVMGKVPTNITNTDQNKNNPVK